MSEVHWDGVEPCLADAAVQGAVAEALQQGGRPGARVDVVFVDESRLTAMHAEHLDDDTPTDVISFDLAREIGPELPELPEAGPAGELYVSVDRAREVASARGLPLERELLLYVVHGALHLCGFDDHDAQERARMRAAEAEVLQRLGQPADEGPHELD